MATFEFRSGKWRAKIVRRSLGIDESATFPTKSQATAWATTREAEILAGSRGLPTGHTVADAIDEFIKRVLPGRKGARWEKLRLEKFKRDAPKLCLKPLHKVTSDDIAKWRDARLSEVSPSSVARELNLWGALFGIAVSEWKWTNVNPAKGVRRPIEPPARRRGITNEEVTAIVGKLNGPAGIEVKIAFLLALETGMRAGEILGLTWSHVDLDNRFVTLPRTKNGDSRQVPLSSAAVKIIEDIRRISLELAMPPLDGAGEINNAAIAGHNPIAAIDGAPEKRCFAITSATLDALFRRARDKAIADCPSVATVRFHDARSEAITRLSRKLDVLELARVVGHRNLSSLMHYYRASAAEIAKKLD